MSAVSPITHQRGAANAIFYGVLSLLVIAGAVIAFLALRESQQEQPQVGNDQGGFEAQWPPPPPQGAEPPAIKTVDMQHTAIQTPAPAAPRASSSSKTDGNLFERTPTRVRPLQHGLTGGRESEAAKHDEPSPAPQPNAVDAFDFGVLDGRVRIGIFGKSAIPDYRVSVNGTRYLIEMPGAFRYVEEFSRRLQIDQFGVIGAQLMRDQRGMRVLIEVSDELRHEPFLIEDAKGLMVAFEPRRPAATP